MNIRNSFHVSSVAVIHGGDGQLGDWEIPARCTTVVFPDDRLVFLDPAHESLKTTIAETVISLGILFHFYIIV